MAIVLRGEQHNVMTACEPTHIRKRIPFCRELCQQIREHDTAFRSKGLGVNTRLPVIGLRIGGIRPGAMQADA
jgi:hypothetical protein